MITTYKYKKSNWIDVQNPTRDEIQHLIETYGVPELAADDFIKETLRGKVDFYEKEEIVHMVLHFPTAIQGDDKNHNEIEIDFVIGKNFIITNHYEEIITLNKFAELFDVNSLLDKSNLGDHAGFMFFHIARELYKSSVEQLETIDQELDLVERKIFENQEEAMVRDISEINRRLIDFKQALNSHEDILKSFETAGATLFGEGFSYYLVDIIGEHRRVKRLIESQKETLSDLKETNDSLLTNKTNKIMKALTIVSFIMIPLTLVTGIFGMNTGLRLSTGDFFTIIIGMSIIGIGLYGYFRGKHWF